MNEGRSRSGLSLPRKRGKAQVRAQKVTSDKANASSQHVWVLVLYQAVPSALDHFSIFSVYRSDILKGLQSSFSSRKTWPGRMGTLLAPRSSPSPKAGHYDAGSLLRNNYSEGLCISISGGLAPPRPLKSFLTLSFFFLRGTTPQCLSATI